LLPWQETAHEGEQVTLDEDELLAGALGALGGQVAGPAARYRVERVARRLRKNVLELEAEVDFRPSAAMARVQQVLAERGRFLGSEDAVGPAQRCVGVVWSGIANLNPAIITVTIRPVGYATMLLVRGAAKEGLIKQRAGEKAAREIAAALGMPIHEGAIPV
jgi:hypothetical protein